jgi:hypothetical protein
MSPRGRPAPFAYQVEPWPPAPATSAPTTIELSLAAEDKRAAAFLRRLLVKPDDLSRAIDTFSLPVRMRMREEHKGVLSALAHFPNTMAESVGEVYRSVTGDSALRFAWTRESQQLSDWATLLGNTMNRALLPSYAERDYHERSIATFGSVRDFRPARLADFDAIADLPTIADELNDYTEVATRGERSVSLSVDTRGAIVTVTRKLVVNDDIQALARLVQKLGVAARRTVAKEIWTLWTDNAVAPDGLTWFHANHANTSTTALGKTAVAAANLQLLKQTEPGTSERRGFEVKPGNVWLLVPVDLLDAARALNTETNSGLCGLYGDEGENIFGNALLSDATDWGVYFDASLIPSIAIYFLMGREEPEFFVHQESRGGGDGPVFNADRQQFKMRHEYDAKVIDHRGAAKATVAG